MKTPIEQLVSEVDEYVPQTLRDMRARNAFMRMWRFRKAVNAADYLLHDGGPGWISQLEKVRKLRDSLPYAIWVDQDGGWTNRKPRREFEDCYVQHDQGDIAEAFTPKTMRGYV